MHPYLALTYGWHKHLSMEDLPLHLNETCLISHLCEEPMCSWFCVAHFFLQIFDRNTFSCCFEATSVPKRNKNACEVHCCWKLLQFTEKMNGTSIYLYIFKSKIRVDMTSLQQVVTDGRGRETYYTVPCLSVVWWLHWTLIPCVFLCWPIWNTVLVMEWNRCVRPVNLWTRSNQDQVAVK